jgi:2-oxoglutarate dehydrogenase E2 component (dihydrolipoamide succinyltransferase)
VEVATDKVDSEIPSPVEGTVLKLVHHEGEIPKVGEVIMVIETGGGDAGEATPVTAETPVRNDGNTVSAARRIHKAPVAVKPVRTESAYLSPLVRFLAQQRGIGNEELMQVSGTGLDGRITRDDLIRYLSGRMPVDTPADTPETTEEQPSVIRESAEPPAEGDEITEMNRMRKIIAAHMVHSKRVAPHVTSFLEADITPLVLWRTRMKDRFFEKEQARLTFTPVFVEAVALALKEFPGINVSLSGDRIIRHSRINVGVATALPDGNLIVPVIRDADRENLGGLSRSISELALRARNNTLAPADVKGGTFTVTNIGQYNNLTGTPIINQPESAILAFGTVLKKPWAVKTPQGYGIAVRDITMLSLTYDHRVIDGALGGSFLSRVVYYLEHFDTNRDI